MEPLMLISRTSVSGKYNLPRNRINSLSLFVIFFPSPMGVKVNAREGAGQQPF
jgi:hypothetical protein